MGSDVIADLVASGMLEEITGQRRNRRFRFARYLALFQEPPGSVAAETPVQETAFEAPVLGAPSRRTCDARTKEGQPS